MASGRARSRQARTQGSWDGKIRQNIQENETVPARNVTARTGQQELLAGHRQHFVAPRWWMQARTAQARAGPAVATPH